MEVPVPEMTIIILNIIIVLVAYLSIYPKLAGENLTKISFYDLLTTCFILSVVGYRYWEAGYEFNLLFGSVNWFWFTLVTYTLIEMPMFFWYLKKHKVKF